MAQNNYEEADWRLFRIRVAQWQERYMEKLICQYIEILANDKKASEKFWDLDRRIRDDKCGLGVLIEMRRSQMQYNLINLLNAGVIGQDDLDGFSAELRELLSRYL